MLRIIAGAARSRKLQTPEGLDTRPTTDRVREALFNILQNHMQDAKVLDLFSGSGAIGFEAISRGAECAVLVDRSPESVRIIQANKEKLGMDNAHVLRSDVGAALPRIASAYGTFDFVWLDPPYQENLGAPTLKGVLKYGLLHPESIVALELARQEEPPQVDGLSQYDLRQYGKTKLAFYRLPQEADA